VALPDNEIGSNSAAAKKRVRGRDSLPLARGPAPSASLPTPRLPRTKLGYTGMMVTLYAVGPGFGFTWIRISSTL
jgi:hypothetical protein